ncbi:MAG: gamma-glutamylcyclotransferase, partial [Planctomycetota bacterium]
MASDQPFCLFVYGTLMNPWVFRTVLGTRLVERADQADGNESFWGRWAILDGYEKISPDKTYQYAVPNKQGRIGGYVVGPLPAEALAQLRHYEGRNYSQRKVQVHTSSGDQQALAFVGNLKQLQHAFGYDFRDRFKQEVILGEKIDSALRVMELEQLHTLDADSRQAVAELRGDTIRDLQRRHFESGGISDYAIRTSLAETPLPSYEHLRTDDRARSVAPHYLRFAIRQVLLNQVEERLYHDRRYELDRMSPGAAFYERTFSLLAAFRMINQDSRIDPLLTRAIERVDFDRHDLIDAVRQGVVIASEIYDPAAAAAELDFIG